MQPAREICAECLVVAECLDDALSVPVSVDIAGMRGGRTPRERRAIRAERALLRRLGGGCRTPIGCLGEVEGGVLRLEGVVCDPDGRRVVRGRREGKDTEPEGLGEALAEDLLSRGAQAILEKIRAG